MGGLQRLCHGEKKGVTRAASVRAEGSWRGSVREGRNELQRHHLCGKTGVAGRAPSGRGRKEFQRLL
jgi:hypothetical protein